MAGGGGDDEARRRALLADPALHAEMEKVIRLRGVRGDRVKDVLQQCLVEGLAKLHLIPLERKEACAYLCGMGRYQAIDAQVAAKAEAEATTQLDPRVPDPNVDALEDQVTANAVLTTLQKRHPKTFPWWFRNHIGDESHEEIAATVGASQRTVRREIAKISQALASANGKRGAGLLLVLLVLLGGNRLWRMSLPGSFDEGLQGTTAPIVREHTLEPRSLMPAPLDEDPDALRQRARDEATTGDWDLVAYDLRRAAELDPAGETTELAALLDTATDHASVANAKPGAVVRHHHHVAGQPLPKNY